MKSTNLLSTTRLSMVQVRRFIIQEEQMNLNSGGLILKNISKNFNKFKCLNKLDTPGLPQYLLGFF